VKPTADWIASAAPALRQNERGHYTFKGSDTTGNRGYKKTNWPSISSAVVRFRSCPKTSFRLAIIGA
jgi:hypothetical protein